MDWLRSEDLKEEKNVTAPVLSITVAGTWHALFLGGSRRVISTVEVLRAVSLRVALVPIIIALAVVLFLFVFFLFVFLFVRFVLKENVGGRRTTGRIRVKLLAIDSVHA